MSVNCDPKDRGVNSIEASIIYDPSALEVTSVTIGYLLGKDAVLNNITDAKAGSVTLALERSIKALPPTREDALCYIVFTIKTEAKGREYPVTVKSVSLIDEQERSIAIVGMGGGVITLGNLAGDADGNGIVDYRDLAILGASYRKLKGNPGFNASCDFNQDERIDEKDLAILKANYQS